MLFTLWTSLTETTGGHADVSLESFVSFVANPTIAAEKTALQGWSPARFRDNTRGGENVELLSAIVLDDDSSKLTTAQLVAIWSPFAGVVHSSFSHTPEHPKHRIVLRASRDMTADEHARAWRAVRDFAASRGQALDEGTRDPSRLWFVPAHREGAPYEWAELRGEPLDVDRILASMPAVEAPAPAPPRGEVEVSAPTEPPSASRKAAAGSIGAAFPPPKTTRHYAQRALAGGLVHDGWNEADAVEFLCDVCRVAGDENREKRVKTVRRTLARKADGKPYDGWTKFATYVDPVVVDSARKLLSGTAAMEARFAQIQASAEVPNELAPHHVSTGRLVFRSGGWGEYLAPPVYVVEKLLVAGSVSLFVAHGGSLKSMCSISVGAAVAMGQSWLDHFATTQGPAVVVDYERGPYEARRRVKLLGLSDVSDFLHCTNPAAMPHDPSFWEELRALKPRLVVIDSLAGGTFDLDVSENEKASAKPLALAHRFACDTQAAVKFIHHVRKGAGGDKRESVRGSTAIFAAVDAVYQFEPLEAPDGIKRMRVDCIKMNLGREPAPFAVELTDEKGLVWYEEPAAVAGRNADTAHNVQAAIRLALANGPVETRKKVRKAVGRRTEVVDEELDAMITRGEVVFITGQGYMLDGPAQRTERVVRNVKASDRWTSAAKLAKASFVDTRVVDALLREGTIVRRVGNTEAYGFLVPPGRHSGTA